MIMIEINLTSFGIEYGIPLLSGPARKCRPRRPYNFGLVTGRAKSLFQNPRNPNEYEAHCPSQNLNESYQNPPFFFFFFFAPKKLFS